MRTVVAFAAVLAATLTGHVVPDARARVESAGAAPAAMDDPAPDFVLTDLGGRAVRLSSLRGHVVVLNFWATWCAPCRVETPWLMEMSTRYRARGLDVLGVSMDDGARDRVRTFVAEHGVTYTILLGNAGVADMYGGVRLLPQTFFIGRDGRIVARTFGIRGREDLERDVQHALGAR